MAEPKKKIKKGSVFIETTKGVYPKSVLDKALITKASKQVKESRKWLTLNGLVVPPYSPSNFLLLYESNSDFASCVNQLSQDVAGLGWKIRLKEDMKENKTEFEKIKAFLKKPNPEYSFRELLHRALIDWGVIGWMSIEVVRNAKREVVEVYHLNSQYLRVHEDKEKFCQIRNNKKVWFKQFGLEKDFASKDGEEGKYNLAKRANELIYLPNYSPKSSFYGLPRILPAIRDVVGAINLGDYNLAFFENYGIPAALIILEGEWEDGSEKKIAKYMNNEIKGSENAHKSMVIRQPEGCKFEYKPLGVQVKEASFRLYENIRTQKILQAYSMPPYRIGVNVQGKLGGTNIKESTVIYKQAVVEPLQEDVEDMINVKLIEEGLQCQSYLFKFNDIDVRDKDAEAERAAKYISNAVKTPNEVRNDLGLEPYPEGDTFYMTSSLIEAGQPEEGLAKGILQQLSEEQKDGDSEEEN